MSDKENISWEYLPIHKEDFNDKYIEIFEYCGKFVVRVGSGGVRCVDILETKNDVVAWTFFNNLVNSFYSAYGES